ncbi:MAG: hypothetical protein J7L34_03770 [Thermotogaceae bacterium]|nr:hypothetical protein [Thermotogaceae bacterium]
MIGCKTFYSNFLTEPMEQLQGEKGAEKIIYVILRELNERYMSRRLRGFERAIEDFLESRSAFKESYQTQFT